MKLFTKKTIAGVFLAFVMVVVSMFAVATPSYAADATCSDGVSGGIKGGLDCASNESTPSTLFGQGSIFTQVVNTLLFIIGAIAVVMLIWGGIRYTTSAGNSNNVTAAKNTIMYAIIGLVIAILAYAIVNFVLTSVTA